MSHFNKKPVNTMAEDAPLKATIERLLRAASRAVQTASQCNEAAVKCYAAAGSMFGTVKKTDAEVSEEVLACNKALSRCMKGLAVDDESDKVGGRGGERGAGGGS